MSFLRKIKRVARQVVGKKPGAAVAWLRKRGLQPIRNLLNPLWTRQAARARAKYCGKFIAVTGSCGKSTTTLLTYRLLTGQRPAALGLHLNTLWGARKLLRRLRRPVDYFVQEVSESPLGTFAAVNALAKPDAAIITSIGLDHLTKFRTVEAVAAEMAVLVNGLSADGVLCVNADEARAMALAATSRARVVTFGLGAGADVRADNVRSQLPGGLAFELHAGGMMRLVQTQFVGTLMLTNILAALAMIHAQGLDLDRAVADVAAFEPLPNRMSVTAVPGSHTYVLDTVKAPLWSSRMLVDDLPNIAGGRRILVLGSLSDIGNDQGRKYRQFLRAAAEQADMVIGLGDAARAVSRLRGLEPQWTSLHSAQSMDEVAALLRVQPPSTVVVKGNLLEIGGLLSAAIAQPVAA